MGYPIRLVSGTDSLQLEPDGPVYRVGDTIPHLSDAQRLSLQASGVRFAVVHDDTPPPADDQPAPILPADQVAVNDELAEAAASSKKPAKKEA